MSRAPASLLLILLAVVRVLTQDTSPQSVSPQSPSAASSSSTSTKNQSSSRKGHHVRVEDNDPGSSELADAEAAIDKGAYASAENLLHAAVERDSTNFEAWFDLGFVENELGKTEQSIAAYRKSVAAKTDVFESNLNLGLQLAKTGDPEAVSFLRAATKLTPTSHVEEGRYRAWLSLGQATANKSPEEALQAFRQASALQPKEAEPHLSAGQIFEREQKYADAENEYKQALTLDHQSTDAIMGLANISMRGGQLPQAEQYLQKLAANHSDSAAVHIQLGRVLAAENKNDAAIAELQAGTKLAPKDEDARRDLAEVYSTAGKNDLAETEYRGLLAAHPNDAELHRRVGQSLLREKKFPEAQQEFVVALRLKPDLAEAYGDLAFAADENKNYGLVIKALDARGRMLPEVPTTYFLRATAYDHLRDFKNAAANYHLFLNSAQGKYPDQEWQARHRLIAIEPKK
ncbi:MAG TPA: tetratricopeptide repeat protein [Candidatus Binatia bacterium]|nr:tetratricopeptide repeat protein [Candidatus Binatia bacterium]